MERPANAVAILSEEPFVAEVSDCLVCGAQVPAATPWYESGSQAALVRYRLCCPCVTTAVYASFVGGVRLERVEAKLVARLRLIGDALEHRSTMIDNMQTGTRQ